MSQCYSITVKIDVTDEVGLSQAVRNFMINNNWPENNYPTDDDTPVVVFESFLDTLTPTGEDNVYITDFNAQYGYHQTMLNIFDEIAPYLADGSFIEIVPDSGYTKTVVENGEAVDCS